jgi:hypothetical protein
MLLWLNVARVSPGTDRLGDIASAAPDESVRARALRTALPELDDREIGRLGLLQAACSRGRSVPPVRTVR